MADEAELASMDYRRTYWLLFLGIGLLFAVQTALLLLSGEPPGPITGVSAVAAVVIVGIAAFALRDPEAAGGPDRPNLLFLVAVAAFVFFLVGAVVQLLAL